MIVKLGDFEVLRLRFVEGLLQIREEMRLFESYYGERFLFIDGKYSHVIVRG